MAEENEDLLHPVVTEEPDPLGDPYDRKLPGQGDANVRPYVYGYYDLTASQRFTGIVTSYLAVMVAIDQRDMSGITDDQLAFVAWGANDGDALAAGKDLMYGEGLKDLYDGMFGEGVSPLLGTPMMNGNNESDVPFGDFGNVIMQAVYEIETGTSETMPPMASLAYEDNMNFRTFDPFLPKSDSAAFFGSALDGGNMSQKAQQVGHFGMNIAEIGVSGSLLSGVAKISVANAGQKTFRALLGEVLSQTKGGSNVVAGLQGAVMNWKAGTRTRRVVRGMGLFGGSALDSVVALMLAGNDDIETEWNRIERSVKAGSMTVEEAAVQAQYIATTTGVAIPAAVLSLDGYEALDPTDPLGSAEAIRAQQENPYSKLAEDAKPKKGVPAKVFRPDPEPVSGEAGGRGTIVLALGADDFQPFGQSGIMAQGATTSTTTGVGGYWGDTITDDDVVGDPVDGAPTKENAERRAEEEQRQSAQDVQQAIEANDPTQGVASGELPTLDSILQMTPEEQEQIGLSPEDIEAIRFKKATEEVAARDRIQQAKWAAEAAGLSPVVGGFDRYQGIRPTISPTTGTAPGVRPEHGWHGAAGASITPESIDEWARGQSNTTTPRYNDDIVAGIIASWSQDRIMWFQDQAVEAGLIDPDSQYQYGQRDYATRQAFDTIVTDANANGNTWEDQLQGNIDAYQKWLSENPDTGPEHLPYGAFVSPTYSAPDYASLAQTTKGYISEKLGRRPSQAEMKMLTNQLAGFDAQQWDSQVQAQRQTHAANARAYEDKYVGGGGEQSGGTTQGVDAEARFQQFFDNKFSGEIKHRERVSQVGQKTPGLFGSIGNIERSL